MTTTRYVAELPEGVVGIEIEQRDATAGARNTVDACALLGTYERWLQSLEDGLGIALDLVPPERERGIAFPDATVGPRLTVDWTDDEHGARRAHLAFPGALWHRLARWRVAGLSDPPASTAAPVHTRYTGIAWQVCDAVLRISATTPGADDLDRLGVGSVLLLPESFEPHWAATLSLYGGQVTLRGELSPRTATFQSLADGDNASCAALQDLSAEGLSVDCHLSLDPARLFAACTLPFAGARYTLSRQQRPVLRGQLMPVSRGYGLLIDTAMPAGD